MISVKRKERESLEAMLRRFNKKIQESGLIDRARDIRFHDDLPSKKQRKVTAIRRRLVREQYNHLRRLGKIEDFGHGPGRRHRRPLVRVHIPKHRLKNL